MGSSPTIGIVGAGGIAHEHLPNLLALGTVHVFAEEGAPKLGEDFGISVLDSLEELIATSDVVVVATPTFTHFEIARQALEARKPVISEKPLTLGSAESAELIDIADRSGVPLFPAHVVRYFPAYAKLKEIVDQGRLGQLAVLRLSRSTAFPTSAAWFGDHSLSGGIILDQMVHDLDIARWVAGEVTSVFAQATRHENGQPIEAAHVLLRHESGAISEVAGTWGPAHLRFSTDFSAFGTGGTVSHSSTDDGALTLDLGADAGAGAFLPTVDAAANPYGLEMADFFRSIAEGTSPRVSAYDGFAAVQIAECAIESVRSGQTVELTPREDNR
jgi:predicted dehydrogenase